MNEFKDHINKEMYEERSELIKEVKESRHANILKRQQNKFNSLCQQTGASAQTIKVAPQRMITHIKAEEQVALQQQQQQQLHRWTNE